MHSALDFNLHIPANALTGVTLLALVASHARYATERFWVRPQRKLKLAMTVVLGGAAIYFGGQTWRLGLESHRLAQAAALPSFSPERATALQRAFAGEPKNFETAYAIGECFRNQSLNGGEAFAASAQQALDWYAIARRDNPYDGYSWLRTGMCLDWLNRPLAAVDAYRTAETLDPNGYFMVANIGWHYVQTGDYAAAMEWFNRSEKLGGDNPIARNYLAICEAKLAAQAAGRPQLPANY